MAIVTDKHGFQYPLHEDFADGNITICCEYSAFKISDTILDLDRLNLQDKRISVDGDTKMVKTESATAGAIELFLRAVTGKKMVGQAWDITEEALRLTSEYDPNNPHIHNMFELAVPQIPLLQLFEALCKASFLNAVSAGANIIRRGHELEYVTFQDDQSARPLHITRMWQKERLQERWCLEIMQAWGDARVYLETDVDYKNPAVWDKIAGCFEKNMAEVAKNQKE